MATRTRTPKLAKAGTRNRVTQLSIVLQGDEPPNEFRIFAAGKVETSKGTFLFDDVAAKAVMADYATQGNELMVDYDHASLAGIALDPAQAGKAAGWFHLEIRNGELWATNVRWTEPAANQLRAKEWRYMSPAFSTDEELRVTGLVNVALTNIPATRRLDPLMAASAREMLTMLSPESVKKALEAIKNGDSDAAMALLEEMIASAAGGDAPAEEPASAPEAAAETAPPADPEKEKPEEVMAASARLMRLTGRTSFVDAIEEVEIWRTEALGARADRKQFAEERAALELGKRKENALALTKLGAETPHTSGLAEGKLCKRLLDEPLAEQTSRVKALLDARGGKLPDLRPPPNGSASADGSKDFETPHGVCRLSASEIKTCADVGADPAVYAANKAFRAMKRGNVKG